MCRAEQFYGLLDKIATFLQDIQSKESEQVVGIIELLWTKRLNWIQSERDKIYSYFKVNELSKRMKETYLNELTPISIKESIAISIFEWDIIESVQDPCFIPILDMLHQQIKLEEEHLLQSQNVDESKWSKYGLSTIEVLFLAFSFYSFQSDLIKQEIVNREGIEIAVRFLTHPSAWVRNSAFRLLSIAIDKKIEFRYEEKQIKMQKSLENEETDIEVECEQCGEIVQFGLFLKHMKSHNIFNDVNYEINEMVEEIDNDQEDSLKAAQKRIFEDIENEGLMESIQPYAFQKIRTMRNASNSFHKSTLGIRTKD
ncbi:MAG: hypothetical protein EZS28_008005 [Streblomastix strix]|uniref:Uncharacterized protein n=1 Tax=Streblomastix strix TaxID=222440 RepID=A0A5J4WNQ9_9EUKA|nr:MAG: hypothetical protein EZS28_008005 [Streblomastix strix]